MLPACVAEFLQYTQRLPAQIQAMDIINYHHYLQERPNRRREGGLSEQMIYHQLYALRLLFIYLETNRADRGQSDERAIFPPAPAQAHGRY